MLGFNMTRQSDAHVVSLSTLVLRVGRTPNTDQRSQYRATDYRNLLHKHEISCGMSAKGCGLHDVVVETFFSILE